MQEKRNGSLLQNKPLASPSFDRALLARAFDSRSGDDPMTITTRFGKKLKVPSTVQIKHQLLLFWLKNQLAKEAAESEDRRASGEQMSIEDIPAVTDAVITESKAIGPDRRSSDPAVLF
jgi:hypothetical protein